ncbi:MAG: class I SAM-dependent methyltransferase [Verrucomicrobiae bacterium]|nr:class I SAM-dependent methyltransferase [Verrucomicrobiae bacterium]
MHIPDPREREVARRYFAPFLKHFHGCRSVVDIASGQGHFLELLKEAGISGTGIELDQELAHRSRQKGLQVIQGNFFEYLKTVAPGTYDAAHVSHIIEHFPPPQVEELFALLHRALPAGAPMVILTPNIANIRRAVGDFWRDPTHVRPYPISAVSKLLRRTGWEVIQSGEHTDRKPSLLRRLSYALRNALFGRYWVGDDVYVIARRGPDTPHTTS